jgi:hypothetical protein
MVVAIGSTSSKSSLRARNFCDKQRLCGPANWPSNGGAEHLGAFVNRVHLVDGLPIPVCLFKRTPGSKAFRGVAGYGDCAAKDETFYGVRGHLLIRLQDVITACRLIPANGSEREALWEMLSGSKGLVIGDKGYLSTELQAQLQGYGINLQTALRENMQDE